MADNRFFRITDQDHRGSILVVSIICASYIPMVLAIRGKFTSKNIGLDDSLAIAVSGIALVQYAVVFVAVSHGLGRAHGYIKPLEANKVGKLVMASVVLFLVALFLTKCCVVLLCRKLFSVNMKRSRFLCDILMIIFAVWCLAAILGLTISCDPLGQIGYRTGFCDGLTTRWIAVGVIDAVTECLIFMLSVIVVMPLQMRLDRKISVILAFAPRLLTIVLIAIHAHDIDVTTHSRNPGVEIVTPIVYQQVQLLFAIVSAALPVLTRGLRKFNTSMGSTWMDSTLSQGSGDPAVTNTTLGSGNIPLKPLARSHSQSSQSESKRRSLLNMGDSEIPPNPQQSSGFQPEKVRQDTASTAAAAYWADSIEQDTRSCPSQESQHSAANIIRKDMQWHVHYEDP